MPPALPIPRLRDIDILRRHFGPSRLCLPPKPALRSRLLLLFLPLASAAVAACLFLFLLPTPPPSTIAVATTTTTTTTAAAAAAADATHPTIWHAPPSCAGSFRTQPADDSVAGFPYAVVRDAVIDRRVISTQELGARDAPGTSRFVLYVTTHLSARLTRENARVVVLHRDVLADVEYVSHITKFLIPRVPGKPAGSYRPGLKTHFGREVTEWQVGVRLSPRDPRIEGAVDLVKQAAKENLQLNITLSVIRHDDVVFPLHVSMGLGCVIGWQASGMEGRTTTCGKDGEGANGAVLFSGSALYGSKKRDERHFREIANFAARALVGPLRYDAVVMSVVSTHSGSDIELQCGEDAACRARLEGENAQLMNDVASTVEDELLEIGVPAHMFSRLLLVPSCRLGSDADRSEKGDPCYKSKRYGQYYATFFTYAALAPFFKWAASHDMDEYFAPRFPASPSDPGPGRADDIFDEVDTLVGDDGGHFVFQWLNFRIQSSSDSRALSTGLIQGRKAELSNRANVSASERCYYQLADNTGKSAVRCDIGFGFTIHHPVLVVRGKRHMEQKQGNRMYYGLRTWHARFGASKGTCDFKAQR